MRAVTTDFFQNMRFKVTATHADGKDYLGSVGFATVTLPTMSQDVVEYKDGTMVYRRKFPGDPTFDDVTFTRGIANGSTELYAWMKNTANGGEYRSDMKIEHLHRTDTAAGTGLRQIKLLEAFPISCKVGSDLDGTNFEVSIQELTVAIENIEITNDVAINLTPEDIAAKKAELQAEIDKLV
jgi:phage tail-like protein